MGDPFYPFWKTGSEPLLEREHFLGGGTGYLSRSLFTYCRNDL